MIFASAVLSGSPGGAQEDPRMTPRAPKSAQERPKSAPEAKITSKAFQNDTQRSPELSKINPEWFQNLPVLVSLFVSLPFFSLTVSVYLSVFSQSYAFHVSCI